jgi:CubicO group peptidase (beta-lactamase class C family)
MTNRKRAILSITIVFLCSTSLGLPDQAAKPSPNPDGIQKALEYSKSLNGLSLVIMQNGKIIFEDYHNGFAKDDAHLLASATKSFSGVLLAAMTEDKLVSSFDEKVSQTITEWAADPLKSQITLRELLNLSSGLDPGPIGRIVGYVQALESKAVFKPGTVYQYGPAPYQIFGEVVKRKVIRESPLEYLTRRIFKPLGLVPTGWRYGQDNNPGLATGANMKATEWIKFGEFIRNRGSWEGRQIVKADLISEILKPSTVNPAYGIGFWLEANPDIDVEESGRIIKDEQAVDQGKRNKTKSPFKIIMSAGAGKQRLYIIDGLNLVVVRQGKASAYSDAEFLTRLLSPPDNK